MLEIFKKIETYYISFFAISLLGSILLGPIIIPRLKKLKFGQEIREEGPSSHHSKKGTPTIGGLIFITAFALPILFFVMNSEQIYYVSAALLLFGAIGFIDDYLKVVKKHNEGLKARQKIVLQILASLVLTIWGFRFGSDILIPFLKTSYDISLIYFPLIFIFYLAVDNAVNLTDGLDGLNASVTFVVMLTFALIAHLQGNFQITMIALGMAGALLGYLKYNWYPAKVFMGDTGSLALGGVVAAFAVVLKLPLFIPIIGFIYFVETLSVMIQVAVFKRTKKRVFKMAPIHHHFELSGYSEKQIVFAFSLLTLIMCIVGVAII